MVSSIGSGLQWANKGNQTPGSSFDVYAQVGNLLADSASISKDASTARQAALDFKTATEQKIGAATVPASADQVKATCLQVLMCGAFAGALDTALNLALQDAPATNTPDLPSNPQLHTGLKGMYSTFAGAISQVEDAARKQPGQLEQAMNLARSQADEIASTIAPTAKNTQDYEQALAMVFYGGYVAGASQAALAVIDHKSGI
ncbi:MAG: hypothetical protein ACYCW6_03050 [Candidatus Xenobia bacterium]